MWQDFKKFILRGNLVDLAIGVVIGAAFGRVVSAFLQDVFMPPLGLITGKVNFTDLFFSLDGKDYANLAAAKAASAPVIAYGNFITVTVDFLIVALVIFMVIKAMAKLQKPAPVGPPPGPTKDQVLLTEIRDLLKTTNAIGTH